MPIGIYSAAAGMAAQQSRIDALSNDLANVQTSGYKSVRVGFRDLAYQAEQGMDIGSGSATVDLGRSFSQGPLLDSGDPLSLAIQGPGFFQVRTQDGRTALTRAGDFQLDAAGSLVTPAGNQLVPPIKVPAGAEPKDVSVSADGTVSVAGKNVAKIALVNVPAPDGLLPLGGNLFLPTQASGAAAPVQGGGTTVTQGMLEGSNVDIANAMVDLLDAQRSYDLASRVIKLQDQLMDTANQLRR